ncbi:MAG: thioredoxin [Oscillospiraceae bacterium]|nr:thioredoxin [Oscillospiraceae bacterium]
MAEITLTEQNFENEVINAKLPVLVDFWATWCGPCQMLGPIISEIAEEYEGKAIVGKVNVDEQSGLAARFGIMSIPTVMVFKNGEAAGTSVGYVPKANLTAML